LVERSQQPVGHEAVLQTHWPPTHCRPSPQGSFEPHLQAPPMQRSALLASHAWQVPPLTPGAPQWMKLVCVVSQVEPLMQQPPQPLAPSHTQVAEAPVPVQRVPVGHGPPVEPHTQAPPVHRFATAGSQVLQVPPGVVPQLVVLMMVWQVPAASQQPVGHDVPSQTHEPLRQRWPRLHLLPLGPHEQLLPTQRSAVWSQATHAAPPVAQPTEGPGALQVLPAQQPLVQVAAQPAQAPLTQVSPPVHALQAAPPVPQWASVDARQLPPASQQPLGHEVPSQTQWPPTQRWPLPHLRPVPHMHMPPVQLSAVVSQVVVHAPPGGPQLVVLMGTQLAPVLQLVGLQTQPLAPQT
jgi:hypothetical protein